MNQATSSYLNQRPRTLPRALFDRLLQQYGSTYSRKAIAKSAVHMAGLYCPHFWLIARGVPSPLEGKA